MARAAEHTSPFGYPQVSELAADFDLDSCYKVNRNRVLPPNDSSSVSYFRHDLEKSTS